MSCLFDSLSKILNISSNKIRNKICDYLESNKTVIQGIDTNELLQMESSKYIEKMRLKSTWGGAFEINCACNIWNIKIIVHNIRDGTKIEFLPLDNNPLKKIKISWNGFHYEPIIKKHKKIIKKSSKKNSKKSSKKNFFKIGNLKKFFL